MAFAKERGMSVRVFPCVLLFLLGVTGCETPREDPREVYQLPAMAADSLLRHLETIFLEESDEAAIGKPRTLWVTDDRIFVSDAFFNRILLFDRSGRYQTYLGGKGQAPWEFQSLAAIVVSDEWILAHDIVTGRVSVFQGETGNFIDQYEFLPWITSGWAIAFDTFLLGIWDRKEGNTMALFAVRDGGIRKFGHLPVVYREHPRYAGMFSTVSLAPTPSGDVLWGVAGLNELFISRRLPDSIGESVDTVLIPVRRRHGVPENLGDWVDDRATRNEWFRAISGLMGLFSIPNGWAAIHYDQEEYEEGGGGADRHRVFDRF